MYCHRTNESPQRRKVENEKTRSREFLALVIITVAVFLGDRFFIVRTYPPQSGEPLVLFLSNEFEWGYKHSFDIDILSKHPTTSVGFDSFQMDIIDDLEVVKLSYDQTTLGKHYLKYQLQNPLDLNTFDSVVVILHSNISVNVVVAFISPRDPEPGYGWRLYSSTVEADWRRLVFSIHDEGVQNQYFNSSIVDELWIGVDVISSVESLGNISFQAATLYQGLMPTITLELLPLRRPIEITKVFINGQYREYASSTRNETITLSIFHPYSPDTTYAIELIVNYADKFIVEAKSPSLTE